MKKPDKKKILKALKILFGVLVVVFLAWYFWKNWDEFSDKIMNVDMGIFIFSMLFYFLYKITLASLWHYITKLNGCAIKYEKAVTSYLYSILGKYIPGKVFMLAARLTYYKEEDAPLSKVTVCFFIENVCTLLGAAMLFIVSLPERASGKLQVGNYRAYSRVFRVYSPENNQFLPADTREAL